jgi:hypothetical protein
MIDWQGQHLRLALLLCTKEASMITSTGSARATGAMGARMRSVTFAAGFCLFAAGMTYAVLTGPRRYATSEQAETATEETANQSTCDRLGIPPSASGHAACITELLEAQQRREDRVDRRNARWM